jgi:large subunit ribosomal protein L3
MVNLIAKKIGMSRIYQENNAAVPFTMVKLYDNCIVGVDDNFDGEFKVLKVGFNKVKSSKNVAKSVAGVFAKNKLPVHKKIYGCKVTKNAEYKIGDSLSLESLIEKGDFLDVSGISIGKGFAGAMKRHNFGGLEASHGISISHRSHGSTGQCQDPGKVFKGKKMAGHMGVDKVTIKNLEVLVVDLENNVIGIKGSIPGSKGGDVVLKIAN